MMASNGEMIVALVDDSATVKTFYKENGHYPSPAGERFHGSDHCG